MKTLIWGLVGFSSFALGSETNYYQHIKPILEDRCQACHTDAGVAFSLENPQVAINFGPAMAKAVEERRMPPWLAEAGHRDYEDDYSLSESEIETFKNWRNHRYAAGDPNKAESGSAPKPVPFNPDFTLTVNQGQPYLPNQQRKDDYRCFMMEWPQDVKTFVTGFQGRPGNTRVAHHLVLFGAGPELVPILRHLEKEEAGPGFQCFGGGIPDRVGDPEVSKALEEKFPGAVKRLNEEVYWLAHWAPGMDGYYFPEGTGIPVEPGSVMIAQMHYFSAFAPGEPDVGSEMDFKIANTVEKPGLNLPLTNNAWLQGKKLGSMILPPQREITFKVERTMNSFVERAARTLKVEPEMIEGIELHSANIHMHALGKQSHVYLENKWGKTETLLAIPNWDLNWQRDFVFTEAIPFNTKESSDFKLGIECTFINHNDTPAYGGFGSDDEMCFNFSYFVVNLKENLAH